MSCSWWLFFLFAQFLYSTLLLGVVIEVYTHILLSCYHINLYSSQNYTSQRKTSDLIPLCHPLPLDRVNITIQLINNQAVIECECHVTHKTGVEMEALTGATIAALTIYDMVKAVSHRVEIGQTVLVRKSGGKSDYVHNY